MEHVEPVLSMQATCGALLLLQSSKHIYRIDRARYLWNAQSRASSYPVESPHNNHAAQQHSVTGNEQHGQGVSALRMLQIGRAESIHSSLCPDYAPADGVQAFIRIVLLEQHQEQ